MGQSDFLGGTRLPDQENRSRFEQLVLPHLDAAYNLAYWLTRNQADAQDVVQEAYLRAWRFFPNFRGGDECAWLLTIVRNTCFTWMQKNRAAGSTVAFDEALHDGADERLEPVDAMTRQDDTEALKKTIEELPAELREVVVLRELQGLSYKEIAKITAVPLGTVMSVLSRARDRLEECLKAKLAKENAIGL
jgi:RNA polymerase sigma factor (sigma-70 family)